VRVLTWNLQWAKSKAWRAGPMLERLRAEAADVAVLTEAQVPMARDLYEHVVDAGPHPKARQPDGSKVVIASQWPIEVVDLTGSPDLPPHNFVAVDVEAPGLGLVRIVGIVIRWNEKRTYIDALGPILERLVTERTVLAGDFNLTMAKVTSLECDLTRHLSDTGLRLATMGIGEALADEPPLIDHIAVSNGLDASDVRVWGRYVQGDERRVSDHAGVSVTIGPRP
jgi:endonuclease/exonuclease/phosphatase family metal-dependent hydrolase